MKSNLTLVVCAAAVAAWINTSKTVAQEVGGDDGKQSIVRMCTLKTVEANQEFQRNVRVVQAQRQNVIDLKAQLDDAKDAGKKAELQKQLDEALTKLNENNQKMYKTYGFTLTRNYILVPEVAHVYMMVSEEEAKKIAEEMKAREAAEPQK